MNRTSGSFRSAVLVILIVCFPASQLLAGWSDWQQVWPNEYPTFYSRVQTYPNPSNKTKWQTEFQLQNRSSKKAHFLIEFNLLEGTKQTYNFYLETGKDYTWQFDSRGLRATKPVGILVYNH